MYNDINDQIIVKSIFYKSWSKNYNTCFSRMHNDRKSEQAHIPHTPSLLGNASHIEWHGTH